MIKNLKAVKSIRSDFVGNIPVTLFLILVSLFALLPIVFIISHAFKPKSELFLYPPRFLVMSPSLSNFRELFTATKYSIIPVSRYIFNSLAVTALTILCAVTISCICAYAFSKFEFPGRKVIFGIIVGSMMLAPEAVGITRFLVISRFGITDTYIGHILPNIAAPMFVFMMKSFMDTIPESYIEAARLEGASELLILAKIVIPLTKAAFATVCIIAFQTAWTDATTSTLYMQQDQMRTLPFYVHSLTSGLANTVARQGAVAAASLFMFVPSFVIFFVLKKSMIKTLVQSGIK